MKHYIKTPAGFSVVAEDHVQELLTKDEFTAEGVRQRPALFDDSHHEVVAWFASQAPTQEQINAQILSDVQNRLDTFAQTRNFAGILSLATYATSTIPKFAAEGQYGVEARDATWATMYQIEQDALTGARPVPQSYADIEADLPELTWPV